MRLERSRYGLRALAIALGLWCGMVLCLELGRRIGVAYLHSWGAESRSGVGAVDGAVFGLLGLLAGFTFNGAAGRFDRRRELVAEEANSIGTAWQRIELLAEEQRPDLRRLFREYVDALIASYAAVEVIDPLAQPPDVTRTQDAVWSKAVAACVSPRGEPARVLLLPSLNDMFGAVERERTMRRIHPPLLVFAMLGLAALAAAVFAGYSLANTPRRNWIYILGVATAISLAMYAILELEYPRLGWVRIDDMDRELTELRAAMD